MASLRTSISHQVDPRAFLEEYKEITPDDVIKILDETLEGRYPNKADRDRELARIAWRFSDQFEALCASVDAGNYHRFRPTDESARS